MANGDVTGNYAKIIEVVKSLLGLSALALLAAGAAFTAAIFNMSKEELYKTFLLLVGLIVFLILINIVHEIWLRRLELSFRLRVSRDVNGVQSPVKDAEVKLLKNGGQELVRYTDDEGFSTITVKVERNDELTVVVKDPKTGTDRPPAAIYSGGQCQMIKNILIPS